MQKIIILAFLVGLTVTTVIPRPDPILTHEPLTYKVSLDDPPMKRWDKIVRDFEVPLKKFMDYFDLLPIPPSFFEGVQWFAKNVYQHKDFVAEVDAVATISGYPFQKMFFLNFFYEFTTFKACTGTVIRTQDGTIIHGRNLDLEMMNLLANLTTKVDYYKGDQKIYSVDHVIGSVFAPTGIRDGAFAINADTRKAEHFYDDLISIMKDDAPPSVWLIRKVLEEETNYADALKRLKTQKIAGPVYYIISGVGPNEGAVIERETESVHGFYELNDERWFLVQTNYDRNQPDPYHDPRRIPAEDRIKAIGQNFTPQKLFDNIMSQWPNFNVGTIMTVLMVPSNGYHNTTVWYGDNPVRTETFLRTE